MTWLLAPPKAKERNPMTIKAHPTADIRGMTFLERMQTSELCGVEGDMDRCPFRRAFVWQRRTQPSPWVDETCDPGKWVGSFTNAHGAAMFGLRNVMEISGASYNQVRYWRGLGLLGLRAKTKYVQSYSLQDANRAGAIVCLLAFVSLQKVSRAMRFLMERSHLSAMLAVCGTVGEMLWALEYAAFWCEDDRSGVYNRTAFLEAAQAAGLACPVPLPEPKEERKP